MRRGFLLLELLVSIFLGSFIALLSAYSAVSMVEHSRRIGFSCVHFMRIVRASHFLDRSLARAPSQVSSWKSVDRSQIIWRDIEHDCAFSIEKGNLVYITGSYSVRKRDWESRHASFVLANVDELVFDFYRAETTIKGIGYRLVSEGQTTQSDVRILGGVLHPDWA